MIPFTQAAHGVDWGGYDYDALQVENMHRLGETDLFIIQWGGAGTDKLFKRARDDGQLTGLYHWQNALQTVQGQADAFSKEIERLNPDVVVVDYEHWWKVWDQYWDAIAGKIPWSKVEMMPPEKISESGRLTTELLAQRWAPGKYFLVYTGAWFTTQYAPSSSLWLKNYPLFIASYPDYGIKPYPCTWDQIVSGYIKVQNRDKVTRHEDNVSNFSPGLPSGLTEWDAWQFSSRRIIPGEKYPMDWIVFNMTPEQLKAKCHKGPVVPPEPTWQQAIDAWAREDPNRPFTGPKP